MATPITVEQSRAIPIARRQAFDVTLPIPLTAIFSRRYALLPPIKQVRGQDGIWSRVGQSRTVVTTDGGTMRELLTDVDAPHSFSYRLSDITGPMRPLVDSIDGTWEFVPHGTGTMITWRWTLHSRALWGTCHAADHLDVAWLRTTGTGAAVRATSHARVHRAHTGLTHS